MSKSITEEMVKDVIKEWARNKAENGEIIFDETFCGGKFVRYKTSKMTSLIPDNIEGKLSDGNVLIITHMRSSATRRY